MKPFRVLVVDDSAFMRKIFSDFIERDPSFKLSEQLITVLMPFGK